MKSVISVAVGTILIAFGFSYGLSLKYYLGHIIGWAGVFLSIGASYMQYREGKSFEMDFLAVKSRHMVGWVEFESIGLLCPCFADEFEGGKAF